MRLVLLFIVFASTFANADPLTKEELVGVWEPINTYQWNIPKYTLVVSETYEAKYVSEQGSFSCPAKHIKEIHGVFHFRCYIETRELVRLTIGGWGSEVAFGFEFWVGRLDNAPNDISGGGPVSFRKNGAKIPLDWMAK